MVEGGGRVKGPEQEPSADEQNLPEETKLVDPEEAGDITDPDEWRNLPKEGGGA